MFFNLLAIKMVNYQFCYMVVKHGKQAETFKINRKQLSIDIKKNFRNKMVRYNFKFTFMENLKKLHLWLTGPKLVN